MGETADHLVQQYTITNRAIKRVQNPVAEAQECNIARPDPKH
jgi:hypothetical protein